MEEINPINNNQTMGYPPLLYTQNSRVLRPFEARRIISVIPKNEQKYKFQALLFSGMRYIECKLVHAYPETFNGENIYLTKEIIKKKKVKLKERHVRLNYLGREAISNYLKCKTSLPTYKTWQENLDRWCKYANIPSDKLYPKSLRKTWESWLLTSYPDKTAYIMASQGHNLTTALEHYLNIGFWDKDIKEMEEFVIGWI